MNKKDAAEFLQIGVRSLERYTSEGRVAAVQKRGKTGVVLDYDPAELERFKAELEAPPEPPPAAPSTATTLARLPQQRLSTLARMAQSAALERERPHVGIEHKPLLKLDEAAALTGLSRATLKEAIEAKRLKAALIGRAWRVRRGDVDDYLKKLF
jgi:excisionase family DNA binding protein